MFGTFFFLRSASLFLPTWWKCARAVIFLTSSSFCGEAFVWCAQVLYRTTMDARKKIEAVSLTDRLHESVERTRTYSFRLKSNKQTCFCALPLSAFFNSFSADLQHLLTIAESVRKSRANKHITHVINNARVAESLAERTSCSVDNWLIKHTNVSIGASHHSHRYLTTPLLLHDSPAERFFF